MSCRTAARQLMVVPDHRNEKVDKFWIDARTILQAAVQTHASSLAPGEAERLAAEALDSCRYDSKAALAVLMSIFTLRRSLDSAKKRIATAGASSAGPSLGASDVLAETSPAPSNAQCSPSDNVENACPADLQKTDLKSDNAKGSAAASSASAKSCHSEQACTPMRDCCSPLSQQDTDNKGTNTWKAPSQQVLTTRVPSEVELGAETVVWPQSSAQATVARLEERDATIEDSRMCSTDSVPLVDTASALPCFRTQLSDVMVERGEFEEASGCLDDDPNVGGSWDYGAFLNDVPDVDLNALDNLESFTLESLGQFPRCDVDQQAMA